MGSVIVCACLQASVERCWLFGHFEYQGVKKTTTAKKIPHKWKNPQGYLKTQDCSFSVA